MKKKNVTGTWGEWEAEGGGEGLGSCGVPMACDMSWRCSGEKKATASARVQRGRQTHHPAGALGCVQETIRAEPHRGNERERPQPKDLARVHLARRVLPREPRASHLTVRSAGQRREPAVCRRCHPWRTWG